MPPSQQTQIQQLVAAQGAARARAAAQAQAMAQHSARQFGGWYDTAAIAAWTAGLAAQMEAIQRLLAQLTDAYLARVLTVMTGRTVRPIGRVDVTTLRSGITHAGAYGRVADAFRYQQSLFDRAAFNLVAADNPTPPDLVTPLVAAVSRARDVAELDTQLAVRAQEHASISAAADRGLVTGWRRVIHPEQARGGSCGLCVAASDRLYGAHEPRPIHADCHCTTLPVIDEQDPGSTLNNEDLGRLYEAAGGTHRSKLVNTRFQVDEHGELGPVLNPAGAKVRTARQAARDTNRPARAKTDAERLATARRIREDLDRTLPRAKQLAADDPTQWGPFLTQLETRIAGLDQQLAA